MGKKKKASNINRPISTESTPSTSNSKGGAIPKKYAFDSSKGTPSSKDPNNKLFDKVLLPADQEHVIIEEILKHKQRGDSASISGRLTNKKLTDLYNALEDVGFKHSQICDAMRSTVSYGGDLHSALDWLCLNLSDDQLPSGFSEKYVEDEKKKVKERTKFVEEEEEPKDMKKKKQAKADKKTTGNASKDPKLSAKEWTLRYAEECSEEESDGPIDGEKQPKSWSREPNEYYLELTAKLLDAQTQASDAKKRRDQEKKKEASDKIQNYIKVMAEVEQHPLFDPKVKLTVTQQPRAPSSKPCEPRDEEEDDSGPGMLALFDAAESEKEAKPSASTKKNQAPSKPPDVRDFAYTNKVWTGKSPKQFLIDWCRKHHPKTNAPKYHKIQTHGNLWRCKLSVERPKQNPLVVTSEILTENSMEAQHLASIHAFWHLAKGQSIHQLLPPPYRNVWLEWMDAEAKEKEEKTEKKNKPRDQFVSQLLKQIKTSPAGQPGGGGAGSDGADSPGDEEAESWEDVWDQDQDEVKTTKSYRKNDSVSSRTLQTILEKNQNTAHHKQLLETRRALPVFNHREQVLDRVRKDSMVIVAGETGSGKSTQVPQFLLEDLVASGEGGRGFIICTQPRRISATSLARRVSQELGEAGPGTQGSLCGYQIRLESRQTRTTRLLYCTTGVLLRKLQLDPTLKDISHIIIDEVHERSVESDFLLIIVRRLVQQRSDLKLVLMSATLDSQQLSAYLYHCPIISIPGRTFPVQVCHLEDVVEDTGYLLEGDSKYALRYESLVQEEKASVSVTTKGGDSKQVQVSWETNDLDSLDESNLDPDNYSKRTRQVITRLNPSTINMDLIVELLHHLEKNASFKSVEGAVLIFMPGLAHIQQLYEILQAEPTFSKANRYTLVALHSVLSSDDQSAAFTVPPAGVRKIVIATNIAETGITIPDVVFVIDAGKVKENRYNERSQMSSLQETYVSKASAKQRQGRAGRVRAGFCFRLYTKHRYDGLRSFTQPEIQRVALEELCLHIMKCSLGDPEEFLRAALDPPLPQAVRASMSLLREVGACTPEAPALTPLGHHLAALPVNVRIGKMLVFAAIFGCLEPVAVIAAAMTDKPPFLVPMGKRGQADAARMAMATACSDHITIYRAYAGWKEAQCKGRGAEGMYCNVNFLSRTALLNIQNVKKDLTQMITSIGFLPWEANRGQAAAANHRALNKRMEVLDISKTDTRGYKDAYPLTPANTALLKAVLAAGLYPNLARIVPQPTPQGPQNNELVCRADTTKGPVSPHPASVNFRLASKGWLIFSERVKLSRVYIRDCTLVAPCPLLLFGGDISVHHREGLVSVDDWIKFQASAKTAVIFKELRHLLDVFLQQKLATPSLKIHDEPVIQALLELLKSEKTR